MPNQHKRAPLSVRLPEAEEARLRAYAEERGVPVGQVVAQAVRELLDRKESPEPVGTE